MLLLYASTIWILFTVLRAAHSWRAGAAGALLAGTDPTYVLTGCFGWCSLQNVLMMACAGLALRYHRTGNRRWLAAAAFCAGLWVWDKALALWLLGGLLLGLAVVFPVEGLRWMKRRNLATAALAFSAGALPLIVFNGTHHFATLRSNTRFSNVQLASKVAVLRATADGSGWLGYLANDAGAQDPLPPATPLERWSEALHDRAGEHRRELMPYAFLAAALLAAVLWRGGARSPGLRLSLLCLIAIGAAWLQMALTEGAGGGAHHPALLWPIPHIIVAIAFAEASFRLKSPRLLAVVVGTLLVSNVLTVNQYLYQLWRFGPAGSWTDAVFALSEDIGKTPAPAVFAVDWGMINPLAALHRGSLPLRAAIDPFVTGSSSEPQRRQALEMFAEPGAVWITHTAGNESFPGINRNLEEMAAAAGYQRVVAGTFHDRNGRPVLEEFRMIRPGIRTLP